MEITIVHVSVKAEFVQEYINACELNHHASLKEPGNHCFDILQSKSDPTQFVLYEAYHSLETAAAHKDTPHYLLWRETVEPWMEAPRVGLAYAGLFPKA